MPSENYPEFNCHFLANEIRYSFFISIASFFSLLNAELWDLIGIIDGIVKLWDWDRALWLEVNNWY